MLSTALLQLVCWLCPPSCPNAGSIQQGGVFKCILQDGKCSNVFYSAEAKVVWEGCCLQGVQDGSNLVSEQSLAIIVLRIACLDAIY